MYLLCVLFWEVDRYFVVYVYFLKENIYCEIVKKIVEKVIIESENFFIKLR